MNRKRDQKTKTTTRNESAYVPKSPTRGWMYSELERLGHRVRGTDFTDSQLARMLIDLGYDVSAKPEKKTRDDSER